MTTLCGHTMRDFDIEFRTPSHGWMTVRISAGVQELHLDVSDVPCDSIRDLVTALSLVLQGFAERSVEWSLEPDYSKWTFCRDGEFLKLAITHSRTKKQQLVYRNKLHVIVHRLIKGLCDLASNDCWGTFDQSNVTWHWAFPKQELAQLKATYARSTDEKAEQ